MESSRNATYLKDISQAVLMVWDFLLHSLPGSLEDIVGRYPSGFSKNVYFCKVLKKLFSWKICK